MYDYVNFVGGSVSQWSGISTPNLTTFSGYLVQIRCTLRFEIQYFVLFFVCIQQSLRINVKQSNAGYNYSAIRLLRK